MNITVSPISGQLHPDQHAIAWGPDGTIWIGTKKVVFVRAANIYAKAHEAPSDRSYF